MRINTHNFRYGGDIGDRFRLYFLGDIHLGSKLCDKEALERDLEEIASDPDRNMVICMGDMGDYIDRHDRRFDPNTMDWDLLDPDDMDRIPAQIKEALLDYFTPLRDQIIGWHEGNHGHRNKSTGNLDRWDQLVAMDLGVPFLGYSGFTMLKFEHERGGDRRTIQVHSAHGWQGGRSSGAKVNRLEKEMGYWPSADIMVRGHSHQLFSHRFVIQMPNQRGTDLVTRDRIVGHTGTYLRTNAVGVSSYSERKGYRPIPIGCLKTWIKITRRGYKIWAGE